MNYVASKVAKRMDSFKVRGSSTDQPRRLLLHLSLGTSSITLLHILDQQLQTQLERTKRTGYELYVLFIDQSSIGGEGEPLDILDGLKQKYSAYTFTTAPLDDVFKFLSYPLDGGLAPFTDARARFDSEVNFGSRYLQQLLASLPSPSSRADMITVLRTRLIIGLAKENGCESILWGDSATRLAERTLAETAKGRGHSLPWQTADGPSPHGISFNFPMRDLLRKEIVLYSNLTSPPLASLISKHSRAPKSSVSSKDTTIDDLMSQYFESVETNYPSIVANVVRTSSRLNALPSAEDSLPCRLCGLPVTEGAQGIHGWGGDQAKISNTLKFENNEPARTSILCYGCTRSTLSMLGS